MLEFHRVLALAACLGFAVGCGDDARIGVAYDGIVGGTPASSDAAVMMLVSYPPDLSGFTTCSAVLVSPTVLLTAAHCIDPAAHPGESFGVFPGADASGFPTATNLVPQLVDVASTHAHPSYDPSPPFFADIGAVVLAQPRAETPLPLQREPLDAGVVGAAARIVGYGQTTYGVYNAVRHQASTTVAALGGIDTIVVGDAAQRSCIGDSGGPALLDVDGVETVVGVDSYSETTGCIDPAHYRRTDTHLAFINVHVPPSDPSTGAGGAGGAAPVVGATTDVSSASSGGGAVTVTAATGGAPPNSSPEVSDDGGCAVGSRRPADAPWGWTLLLVAAWGATRWRPRASS